MKKQAGLNPIPGPKASGKKKHGPTRTAQSGFNPLPGGGTGHHRGPGAAAGLNPLPVGHRGGHAQTLGHAGPIKAPKPKRPKRKKPVRKWSPGVDVACCSAQAVGTLLGWGWPQVLDLYWRTADDPDAGATIEDTLAAACTDSDHAGFFPCNYVGQPVTDVAANLHAAWSYAGLVPSVDGLNGDAESFGEFFGAQSPINISHPLILGVDLPGQHAIAVTPDGTWWSWGEPFNPGDWPDMVIDEAWAVLL